MDLNILQDLKDTAAQYAYMRVHTQSLRYTSPLLQPEKYYGHSLALAKRAQYAAELVAEMRDKLTAFLKKAQTECL
jgi:hypothetical protein